MLEADDIGSDLAFLPSLQEIVIWNVGAHADSLYGLFIHARQLAGHPISLCLCNL